MQVRPLGIVITIVHVSPAGAVNTSMTPPLLVNPMAIGTSEYF